VLRRLAPDGNEAFTTQKASELEGLFVLRLNHRERVCFHELYLLRSALFARVPVRHTNAACFARRTLLK